MLCVHASLLSLIATACRPLEDLTGQETQEGGVQAQAGAGQGEGAVHGEAGQH